MWKLNTGTRIDITHRSIIIWLRSRLCGNLRSLLVIDIKVTDLQTRLRSGTPYCSDYLSSRLLNGFDCGIFANFITVERLLM